VQESYELMVISQSGIVMRTTVQSIAKVGRIAQGVHVMNVGPGDRVAGVAVIDLSKTPASGAGGDGNGAAGSNGRRARGSGRRPGGRRR
jgi:DNA gyrase subunit A